MKHDHQPKQNYWPLVGVISVVILFSALWQQFILNGFSVLDSMRLFMAFFFLLFGLFKLIDIKKFVDMYAEYDVITKRFRPYGFIYPFIELTLGGLLLFEVELIATNIATFIVMTISSIGVIGAVTNKKRIRCACLGAIVKLPMSTVTIIEDVGMGVMALIMLLMLWQ